MKTLLLQIRDDGTHIPVMSTLMESDDPKGTSILRRAAFYGERRVSLTNLNSMKTHVDIHAWSMGRTMTLAHKYIRDNWDSLKDGDVIDVEYILGERTTPKEFE